MPENLVRIQRVYSSPCSGGLMRHIIDATNCEPPILSQQFQTVSDARASVCEQAQFTNTLARVRWEQTAYGHTLKAVALEPVPAAHQCCAEFAAKLSWTPTTAIYYCPICNTTFEQDVR